MNRSTIARWAVIFFALGVLCSIIAGFKIDSVIGFFAMAYWFLHFAENLKEWADEKAEAPPTQSPAPIS